jgi:hypothetical protein
MEQENPKFKEGDFVKLKIDTQGIYTVLITRCRENCVYTCSYMRDDEIVYADFREIELEKINN